MRQDNEGLWKYLGSYYKLRGAIQWFKHGSYDYFCILVSKLSDKHNLAGTSK